MSDITLEIGVMRQQNFLRACKTASEGLELAIHKMCDGMIIASVAASNVLISMSKVMPQYNPVVMHNYVTGNDDILDVWPDDMSEYVPREALKVYDEFVSRGLEPMTAVHLTLTAYLILVEGME